MESKICDTCMQGANKCNVVSSYTPTMTGLAHRGIGERLSVAAPNGHRENYFDADDDRHTSTMTGLAYFRIGEQFSVAAPNGHGGNYPDVDYDRHRADVEFIFMWSLRTSLCCIPVHYCFDCYISNRIRVWFIKYIQICCRELINSKIPRRFKSSSYHSSISVYSLQWCKKLINIIIPRRFKSLMHHNSIISSTSHQLTRDNGSGCYTIKATIFNVNNMAPDYYLKRELKSQRDFSDYLEYFYDQNANLMNSADCSCITESERWFIFDIPITLYNFQAVNHVNGCHQTVVLVLQGLVIIFRVRRNSPCRGPHKEQRDELRPVDADCSCCEATSKMVSNRSYVLPICVFCPECYYLPLYQRLCRYTLSEEMQTSRNNICIERLLKFSVQFTKSFFNIFIKHSCVYFMYTSAPLSGVYLRHESTIACHNVRGFCQKSTCTILNLINFYHVALNTVANMCHSLIRCSIIYRHDAAPGNQCKDTDQLHMAVVNVAHLIHRWTLVSLLDVYHRHKRPKVTVPIEIFYAPKDTMFTRLAYQICESYFEKRLCKTVNFLKDACARSTAIYCLRDITWWAYLELIFSLLRKSIGSRIILRYILPLNTVIFVDLNVRNVTVAYTIYFIHERVFINLYL